MRSSSPRPAGSAWTSGPLRARGAEPLLHFAVRDSGIGIAADKMPRLFQEFSQTESSTARTHGGTGLGLSICRRIIEAMGGRVGVDSVAGVGSTFWFEVALPIAAAPAAARPAVATQVEPEPRRPEPRDAGGRRETLHWLPRIVRSEPEPDDAIPRMLIVDDVKPNLILMRELLRDRGYELDCVEDGAAAVTAARQHRYALILMDLQMPVLGGLAATRQIRQREGSGPATPIVGLTADAAPSIHAECAAAGMQDMLPKPIDMARLNCILDLYAPLLPLAQDEPAAEVAALRG